jgi:hypothetical protein
MTSNIRKASDSKRLVSCWHISIWFYKCYYVILHLTDKHKYQNTVYPHFSFIIPWCLLQTLRTLTQIMSLHINFTMSLYKPWLKLCCVHTHTHKSLQTDILLFCPHLASHSYTFSINARCQCFWEQLPSMKNSFVHNMDNWPLLMNSYCAISCGQKIPQNHVHAAAIKTKECIISFILEFYI